MSAQVTVGYGFSASGDYSQSKINADYASVTEQSGIYAGDKGYQIHIANHTDLTGALITSTDRAEREKRNRFTTGTLAYRDIANHADYSGNSFGVGGSMSMGGGAMPDKLGDAQLMTLGNNARTQNGKTEGETAVRKSLGFGRDKDSQSSLTKSGINTANIQILNEREQLAKTGQSAKQTVASIKTDITTDNAAQHSGKLAQNFDKEKVLKELNIQVAVTAAFRQNAFSAIDSYVLSKQATLRDRIKQAKTEEEKTALYKDIYKLQYQKRLLETTVGILSGSPELAITQGTLQLAATKMREESLANSRKFKGIIDAKTGQVLRNDSYDSGYFDGVKLGGVRIDTNVICNSGFGECTRHPDGSIIFKGNKDYTISDAIDPAQNKAAKHLYGETGGFQPVKGEWNLHITRIPYAIGSLSDHVVESFAGTHDMLGGQIWGWYDKEGNTIQKNALQSAASGVTTVLAIPVSAPFAISDLMSSDMVELLMRIGGR